MKLLLAAATTAEIAPLNAHFGLLPGWNEAGNLSLHVLVTGVGMVATAFAMGKVLGKETFDLAINAGIAGAFDRSLSAGDLVEVTEDIFSELGAEDHDRFIDIEQLGFGTMTERPLNADALFSSGLTGVKSVTVNTVHGNAESIRTIRQRLSPQTESMEGAAFFYACRQYDLPSLQIRAISNYVEPRNRENWNIPLAVQSLNAYLITRIEELL
jgi:futalosine hydrolase